MQLPSKVYSRRRSIRHIRRRRTVRIVFFLYTILLAAITATEYSHSNDSNGSTKAKTSSEEISKKVALDKSIEQLGQFYSPLSGEVVWQENLTRRQPLIVKIDNSLNARPQSGLYKASIVYESLAEDGYTKFNAIYLHEDSNSVGPIRGARIDDITISSQYNSLYAHLGGTDEAIKAIKDFNIFDLDLAKPNTSIYSWQNEDRSKPYNLFSGTKKLRELSAELGHDGEITYKGFEFKQDKAPPSHISSFTVSFSSKSSVLYKYEPQTNSFFRFQDGVPHIEAMTGKQLAVKNVVIMFASPNYGSNDNNKSLIRPAHKLDGKGEATFLIDGVEKKGHWIANTSSPPLFYDGNSHPVKFNAGNTWIEVLPARYSSKHTILTNKSYYVGKEVRKAPFKTKKIALTFDDGPSINTLPVIDILKRYNVGATFFFVGSRIGSKIDVLKQVAREGFEIGNHSYNHIGLKNRTEEMIANEIKQTDDVISRYTGAKPVFVRPPAGHFDKTTIDTISGMDKVMALWSVHGHDTRKISSRRIASGVISSTRGGSIVLLHETNPRTVEALPSIIERLQAKGYELVTLSELLSP